MVSVARDSTVGHGSPGKEEKQRTILISHSPAERFHCHNHNIQYYIKIGITQIHSVNICYWFVVDYKIIRHYRSVHMITALVQWHFIVQWYLPATIELLSWQKQYADHKVQRIEKICF